MEAGAIYFRTAGLAESWRWNLVEQGVGLLQTDRTALALREREAEKKEKGQRETERATFPSSSLSKVIR